MSFLTKFSPLWRLCGKFPQKIRVVGIHIVLLPSIMCCCCPYSAVGIQIVLLASQLMLVLMLASLYYFWHPCCYGSPFCCWRWDVPTVSAAVGLPPSCSWLHCFCKHPCFWCRPYCVGGRAVAFIPAAACFSAVVSSHDIAVIINVACCWRYCCCLCHCCCLHPDSGRHSCCCWRSLSFWWFLVAGLSVFLTFLV